MAARAVSIVLVLETAGLVIFRYALHSHLGPHANDIQRRAFQLAIIAAILVVLQHFVAPARFAGSFSGIADGSLQDYYLHTNAGIAHGLRLLGLLLVVIGLAMRSRGSALAGAMLACLSFAAMGHTTTYSPRWLLAPLLSLHVVAVAFWFGALRPLRRCSHNDSPFVVALLDRFSTIASRVVPFILIAGLGLVFLFLDSFAQIFTPYGWMVVGKFAGFVLLLGLASANRWRLLPRIRGGEAAAIATFRAVALVEWLVMVLLIVTTVSVTSLFSP